MTGYVDHPGVIAWRRPEADTRLANRFEKFRGLLRSDLVFDRDQAKVDCAGEQNVPPCSPRRQGGYRQSRLLLIADGRNRSIEFRDIDRERLVVGAGTVLQDAYPNRLAQQ